MIFFFSKDVFFDLHKWTKKVVLSFIIFLPFQNITSNFFTEKSFIYKLISYLDEFFTIFLVLALLVFILVRPNQFKFYLRYPFTKYLIALLCWGFFSLIINEVDVLQGLFGIYDIFKNLIVLYIFSSFSWSKNEFEKIIKIVIFLGILLSFFGIFTEIIALLYGIGINEFVADQKRFGLYRTLSIVGPGNGNYLALYCLLSFFLLLTKKTKKFFKLIFSIIILINIFLTFSRQAWLGLAIGVIFLIERKVLRYIIGTIIVLFFIIIIIFMTLTSGERYEPEVYYRSFTMLEALRICKENPFIGTGPGTFGGVSSVIFESSLYDQWPFYFKQMLMNMGSIDSYWPSIAAELGILGVLFLILFFVSLLRYNLSIKDIFFILKVDKIGIIGKAISAFSLVIIIMNTFTGFNKAFVTYTFLIINGIYLSLHRRLILYKE